MKFYRNLHKSKEEEKTSKSKTLIPNTCWVRAAQPVSVRLQDRNTKFGTVRNFAQGQKPGHLQNLVWEQAFIFQENWKELKKAKNSSAYESPCNRDHCVWAGKEDWTSRAHACLLRTPGPLCSSGLLCALPNLSQTLSETRKNTVAWAAPDPWSNFSPGVSL